MKREFCKNNSIAKFQAVMIVEQEVATAERRRTGSTLRDPENRQNRPFLIVQSVQGVIPLFTLQLVRQLDSPVINVFDKSKMAECFLPFEAECKTKNSKSKNSIY